MDDLGPCESEPWSLEGAASGKEARPATQAQREAEFLHRLRAEVCETFRGLRVFGQPWWKSTQISSMVVYRKYGWRVALGHAEYTTALHILRNHERYGWGLKDKALQVWDQHNKGDSR
jgi:hypothetical protein